MQLQKIDTDTKIDTNTNINTNRVNANSFLGFRISVAVHETPSHGIANTNTNTNSVNSIFFFCYRT